MNINLKDILTEKNMPIVDAVRIFLKYGIDPRNISKDELQREWRKLTVQLHPDKGGNEEEMKLVNSAYDSLKDSNVNINVKADTDIETDEPSVPSDHMRNPKSGYDDEESPPRGYSFGTSHTGERANLNPDYVLKTDTIRVSESDLLNEQQKFQKIVRKYVEQKPGIGDALKKYFPICYEWIMTNDASYFMSSFRDSLINAFHQRDNDESMKTYETLMEFTDKLRARSIENPENPSAYPIFVTLYDRTEHYGGEEEGGWFYKNMTIHITNGGKKCSKQVKSYKEATEIADRIFETISNASVDGQPLIVFEKEMGLLEKMERPNYS